METNWKKGDTAICVNNGELGHTGSGKLPNLRLNAEYMVNGVHICNCGVISLDVGLANPPGVGVVCKCKAISSPASGVHWAHSSRFVKKRTAEQIREEINAAVEDEEFKYAMELQNELDTLENNGE